MNGLHELPLVIFTVLAQSAVGAWLIFCVVLWLNPSYTDSPLRSSLHKAMFVLLALLGVGFVASILHLGTPARAFNSLNRVGSSMLSNEIASGAAFFALAGLYWLLSVLGKMPAALEKIGLIFTALLGVVFMYMMNQVYHISTVPTWNSSLTSWQFYLTVVIGGSALAYAFLSRNHHLRCTPILYPLGVFLAAIVVIYQGFGLSQIHSSVQQAASLVPDYAVMQVVRLCLLAVGGLLLFKVKNVVSASLAVVIILFAEMIGRTLFYGLYMTAGMAVGS
ncbi:dimethyl sulfoxide reductase [Pasteurellaceae bacterium Pebbles2]|nr:dimethyl sulfoxide reductase [Pasteurellaceae bacterium Pebbles2]